MDADTVLIVDTVGDSRASLTPDELAATSEMTLQRSREFAAGRRLGRLALAALGQAAAIGIPMGVGGEPVWPQGIVGSISHTERYAGALVAKFGRHLSVGFDLDDGRPVGDIAAAGLMTTAEIDAVIGRGWANTVADAQTVVFSAKEALFKCQYPRTRRRELDFDEVCLVAARNPAALTAHPTCGGDAELGSAVSRIVIFSFDIQGVKATLALMQPQ
jgi:4'-phosphopantetheinyl transferase EntD